MQNTALPTVTSSNRRSRDLRWRVVDIVVASVIGVASGIVFWAWGLATNVLGVAFEFLPGPLFHSLILVDEVNRAPPKVQSALLEAMAEGQITVSGATHPLADPFMVVATQNPIEHAGTFPLPEAQLDRFLLHVVVEMPDEASERRILDLVEGELNHHAEAMPVRLSVEEIRAARAAALAHIVSAIMLVTLASTANAGASNEALVRDVADQVEVLLA